MVLGFTTDTETAGLEAWEQYANELSETSGIQDSDTLGGAARSVVGINSATGNGSLATGADLVDPKMEELVLKFERNGEREKKRTYQSIAKT